MHRWHRRNGRARRNRGTAGGVRTRNGKQAERGDNCDGFCFHGLVGLGLESVKYGSLLLPRDRDERYFLTGIGDAERCARAGIIHCSVSRFCERTRRIG